MERSSVTLLGFGISIILETLHRFSIADFNASVCHFAMTMKLSITSSVNHVLSILLIGSMDKEQFIDSKRDSSRRYVHEYLRLWIRILIFWSTSSQMNPRTTRFKSSGKQQMAYVGVKSNTTQSKSQQKPNTNNKSAQSVANWAWGVFCQTK